MIGGLAAAPGGAASAASVGAELPAPATSDALVAPTVMTGALLQSEAVLAGALA